MSHLCMFSLDISRTQMERFGYDSKAVDNKLNSHKNYFFQTAASY